MSNLTTRLKTHVIVTFNKSFHFISQKQFELVSKMDNNKKFTIENNVINTSGIAEILTIEQFYNNYPDKKPVYDNLNIKDYTTYKTESKCQIERIMSKVKDKNKPMREMIKGITKFIDENTPANKAKALREKMRERLSFYEAELSHRKPIQRF